MKITSSLHLLSLLLIIFKPFDTEAQVIPIDRTITWQPGVEGGITNVPVGITLTRSELSAGAPAQVIQEAVDAVESPGAVLLPGGEYELHSGLRLRSGVVLRGQGATETRLIFRMNSRDPCIRISGWKNNDPVPIASGHTAGSQTLVLRHAEGLNQAQSVLVFSDNDADLMYTSEAWNRDWAAQSLSQIVRVADVTGNRVSIDVPLRLTYREELRPRLDVLKPVISAGVENLYIKRLDDSESSIIDISYAQNCWVRGIESEYCMRAHIWIRTSRFITVENSYFHHAYSYGGGGHGYGVVAGSQTNDCLVTNNIFRSLRHSMMVKEGANGNVFSYNYSFENVRLCDISIHGHYSYMNLFEGNIVQFVQYADYWGPTGPLTTMFRNRVTTDIRVNDHSHDANIVANVLPGGRIRIAENCRNALVEGNRIGGQIMWNDASPNDDLPSSLYLESPPAFWGSLPWPAFGPDVEGESPGLPAELRTGRYTPRPNEDRG